MTPDFLVKGWWVDCFLIYWAVCYISYFIITWVSFKIRPDMHDPIIYIAVLTNCLYLPLRIPIQLIYHWRHRNDPIYELPVEPDALTQNKIRLYNNYLKEVDRLDATYTENKPGLTGSGPDNEPEDV